MLTKFLPLCEVTFRKFLHLSSSSAFALSNKRDYRVDLTAPNVSSHFETSQRKKKRKLFAPNYSTRLLFHFWEQQILSPSEFENFCFVPVLTRFFFEAFPSLFFIHFCFLERITFISPSTFLRSFPRFVDFAAVFGAKNLSRIF